MTRIAKLLKSHRERKGLLQKHIAKAIGAQSYGAWERGTALPPAGFADVLCGTLSIAPAVYVEAAALDYKESLQAKFNMGEG